MNKGLTGQLVWCSLISVSDCPHLQNLSARKTAAQIGICNMIPRCPKKDCESSSFVLTETTPMGSRYKINLVCCAKCGCVIGALEKEAVGVLVYSLARALGFSLSTRHF